MTDDQVPVRVDLFMVERLDDDLLLYHPTKTLTVRLNESASAIWDLCDSRRSVAEMAAVLREAFPDDGDAVVGDMKAALARFEHHGAIRFV